MNTRLQVEHPVTECITGLDLVEQQIRIARGETLTLEQSNIKMEGHAIELRVYAEDSYNDFLPNVGKLNKYTIPQGQGIRLDDGYEEGMEIPIFYDPMISKLIAFGNSREEAIQTLIEAIDSYFIEGVRTTLPFGRFVLQHESFRSANFDTHFVRNYYSPEKLMAEREKEMEVAAKLALKLYLEERQKLKVSS
jgi:propionyl-CoA carboxylase alpha chain